MSTYQWKKMDADLLSMVAKVARDEPLSAAEQLSVAEFLKGHAGTEGDWGFSTTPTGDVRGSNNLRRTNWFNGRYLTAEALSRQDVYFDARLRLAAHAQMPGIAWGLGIGAAGANATPVHSESRTGGMPAGQTLTLRRGLAFDHVGRPILVSEPFTFTIEKLLGAWRKTPQKVVGGGIDFMPCVCLADDPAGPTGGSALVPSGPYLLVIQPNESEEGGAKVMGEICGGAAAVNCRAEAWRGGFGLSLVRFPVELPLREDLVSAWDLRGTLSAYFFDVFEHPLWKRWDPGFLTSGPFCSDTGPGRHDAAAVALAMVYLGEDGSVLFLDQWIPRRTICDSPAEDWHRTRFGAPPRAAAWARIHQFQCMLAESLTRQGLGSERDDLYSRGFRHIPPIGFLPITPEPPDGKVSTGFALVDNSLNNAAAAPWLVSPRVFGAIEQARRYFQRSRVISYAVVALHDDDILEDLHNVFDKDPIQLARRVAQNDVGNAGQPLKPNYTHYGLTDVGGYTTLPGYLGVLARLFETLGLEDLVNRRTEIVKLVVPLQGLTRRHPLVGVLQEDAMDQTEGWGVNPLLTAGGALGPLGTLPQAEELAGLIARIGLDMLPRHFVVYVKQRLVLLDLLFYVLEILEFLFKFLSAFMALAGGTKKAVKTAELRQQYLAQPADRRAMVEAVLAQPDVQANLVRAADLSGSGLSVSRRNQEFLAKVDTAEAGLANTIADPVERRRAAIGQVADAYAAEYPDYQLMQVLAAVQPPQQTLIVVTKLSATRPTAKAETLADELAAGGPPVFADADAQPLYADLRASLDERKVADYVEGADSATASLTVKDILARPPAEARLLLGADNYARFRDALQADRNAALAGAEALGKGVPQTLIVKVETAIDAGTPAAAAIDQLKADSATNGNTRPLLDHTANLLRITGGKAGFLKLVKRT